MCAWAAWLHKLPCSIVSMLNTNVFRQIYKFPCSTWRAKFFVQTLFIDLVGTGRFTFINKNMFCILRFPRSITDWDCWLLTSLPTGWCSTVEPNSSFPLVQLWYRVSMRSLVVVEETSMIFHIRLLQSSISQFLDYNELEVSPERKLHSIEFDRMLILLWSKD